MGEPLDVPTLLEQMRKDAEAIHSGDMRRVEVMLANQATALQTLFACLAERGMNCDQTAGLEANFRMGLRAQSPCRATLEPLVEIKNPPPVAFVKQENIANGPQQVNNGELSCAGESTIQSNELSGGGNGLHCKGLGKKHQGD